MSNTSTMLTGAPRGDAHVFTRDGYAKANGQEMKNTDVETATVFGHDDDTLGSISSLEVGTDGKITDAVIDVGGFLGMGAHSVKVPFSDLTVLRKTDGSDVRVYLDATKDSLKAMPHNVG
jgi:hypothetical protein